MAAPDIERIDGVEELLQREPPDRSSDHVERDGGQSRPNEVTIRSLTLIAVGFF